MRERPKLPKSQFEFADIRRENYLYVDKTGHAWQLANENQLVFLARPRRFGKSMLISTLEAYFQGESALFEGLKLERLEAGKGAEAWRKYPVIRLNFSGLYSSTEEILREEILGKLKPFQEKYPANYQGEPTAQFATLLRTVYEQEGQIVLLIDEYDKPLFPLIGEGKEEVHDAVAQLLRAFYGNIKSSMKYLRFAMLTGVSQYSHLHLASDLNNLFNISFNEEYSAICGLTEGEIRQYLHPAVEVLAEAQNLSVEATYEMLKYYYDGYNFHERGEHVYNPYSIINALAWREFKSFWFDSGTSKVLPTLLPDFSYDFWQLEGEVRGSEFGISKFEPRSANPVPLLYQYGYLTISRYDPERRLYYLTMPNQEVRESFWMGLLNWVADTATCEEGYVLAVDLWELMRAGDIEGMMRVMTSAISGTPYSHIPLSERAYEERYRDLIYLLFLAAGAQVHMEVHSDLGRSDVEVELEDVVYIFELKVERDSPISPEEAIWQVERQAYAHKHEWKNKRIVVIGVVFRKKNRREKSWKVVELEGC